MIQKFEDVRNWGKKRGLNKSTFHAQYQRLLQEIVEIHEAYIDNDTDEVADAIGDSLIVLINLAKTVGLTAEECLNGAFNVIELRKGLTKNSSFVRYGKLSKEEQKICDNKQGEQFSQYYDREEGELFDESNFTA